MLSDSFLKHPDLPTSLLVLCFILFTGYLLSRELNTNCVSCFALTQFKIISHQAPIYLSELHLYTPSTVPGSSALLQTSECSEYHPSALSPVVSTLFFFFFSFYQAPPTATNSCLSVSVHHATSVSCSRSSLKTILCSKTFSPAPTPCPWVEIQMTVYMCMCVCERERERVHVIIVNQ